MRKSLEWEMLILHPHRPYGPKGGVMQQPALIWPFSLQAQSIRVIISMVIHTCLGVLCCVLFVSYENIRFREGFWSPTFPPPPPPPPSVFHCIISAHPYSFAILQTITSTFGSASRTAGILSVL